MLLIKNSFFYSNLTAEHAQKKPMARGTKGLSQVKVMIRGTNSCKGIYFPSQKVFSTGKVAFVQHK